MPAVLDHWTSGSDHTRRQTTFRTGDPLQWHAIVQGNPADPTQRIRLVFIAESLQNIAAVDESARFELVVRPQSMPEATFTVGGFTEHAHLDVASIPPAPTVIPERPIAELTWEIARGLHNLIFVPSLYSFRVYIAELDPPDQPFALSEPWLYEIT